MGRLIDEVAGRIRQQIESGSLPYGERVPSVREASRLYNVSLTTALEAYRYLESIGYLEARERSGFFASRPASAESPDYKHRLPKSVAGEVKTTDLILEVFRGAEDPDLAPFALGLADESVLPYKRVNREVAAVLRANPGLLSSYAFPPGPKRSRAALARWLKPFAGGINPDEIILTGGCLEAVHVALAQNARPGGYVAVESPCYFGILQVICNLQLKAIEIPTSSEAGMDPAALEKAMRDYPLHAVVISAHAQNPLGFSMPEENLHRIYEACAAAGVPIVEDDVYGDLVFERRPFSLKAFDRKGIVSYCGSFSKTVAPGVRVGWLVPRAGTFDECLRGKISLNVASESLGQHALAGILQKGNLQSVLQDQRRYYRRQIGLYRHFLVSALGESIRITQPSGSFFLWCRVPGLDVMDLFRKAVEQGVGFSPGPMFSASGAFRECFRLNCSHPLEGRNLKALERLCSLLRAGIRAT